MSQRVEVICVYCQKPFPCDLIANESDAQQAANKKPGESVWVARYHAGCGKTVMVEFHIQEAAQEGQIPLFLETGGQVRSQIPGASPDAFTSRRT